MAQPFIGGTVDKVDVEPSVVVVVQERDSGANCLQDVGLLRSAHLMMPDSQASLFRDVLKDNGSSFDETARSNRPPLRVEYRSEHTGRGPEEGRKELNVSRNLLYLKEQQVESRLDGNTLFQAPLERTHEANPEELAALRTAENESGPQIASSYDNLGVNTARDGDFANASRYFEEAAHWNPTLSGVDDNWSRAAFAAKPYGRAVEPLTRILAVHPEDSSVRSMLGLSLCITHDYARAVAVLQPMELVLGSNPQLAIAYAGSMALAGDSNQGMDRLKSLEARPGRSLRRRRV